MAISGQQLRTWRLNAGVTQAEAAEAHGISQEAWSMMESGKMAIPRKFSLRKWAGGGDHARGPYRTGTT